MILTSRQSVTIPAHLTDASGVTIRLDDEQIKLDEWEDPSEFRSDIHVESAKTARKLAAALIRAADMMEAVKPPYSGRNNELQLCSACGNYCPRTQNTCPVCHP